MALGNRLTAWLRRPARRWLIAGGAVGVAAVVGLAVAVSFAAVPACAALPAPGAATHQGRATFYDSRGDDGNCSFVTVPTNRFFVALGPAEYAAGAACGGFLDVTGPRGTVRVLVADQCPECEPGHLDLSREAFTAIADPVQGIVAVTYRAVVDPPLPGPLTFRMKDGTSQYWFAVLVGDHGNPLTSVEVRTGASSWRGASRQSYNYWIIDGGAGTGPYTIRVTDAYGHQAIATGVRLAPEQTQRSSVRMYGVAAAPATVRTTAAAPVAVPTTPPAPTAIVSPAAPSASSTVDGAVTPPPRACDGGKSS